MQRSEIIRRVTHLDEVVNRAAQACRDDESIPEQVRQSVRELDERTNQARQLMQNEQDDARIVRCIDDLEALGDRAKHAVEQAPVGADVTDAIFQAHSELSSLKRQLH